jgi:hypothetical protein
MTKRVNQDGKILAGRFLGLYSGFDPLKGDFGPIWVRLVGDRSRWGIEEVVALHVKPDKMPELKRETFTA